MSDNAALITENLALWTQATVQKSAAGRGRSKAGKTSLYGVEKLRALILDLAVRGKLVPQQQGDEPASELLKRIKAEKSRLIKDGKIKKGKALPAIKPEETPFDLPQGWEWECFGEVMFNRDSERIPLSLDNRKYKQGEYDYYGASGVIDKIDDYIFDKPLLLIGEDGANLINRSTPIAFIAYGKYWVNNHAHVLDAINELFLNYIRLFINSIDLKPYVTGTAQPKMNQTKMNSILLALPPLAEQKRIVAKVDELMALCDALEAGQAGAIAAHQQLVETLLDSLTQSTDAKDLAQNWTRIETHFDTLFTTENSIDQLKQTVLQLAVMGKLVPQNPADEPAAKLLTRIKAEKAKLIKDGKIKKSKALPAIKREEKPFDLPQGWEWVRLQNAIDVRDGTHDSPKDAIGEDTFPLVTSKNFKNGEIDFENARRISAADHFEIIKRSFVEKGDVLFSMIGGNIGNQVMVRTDISFSIKNVALFKYYDSNLTSPEFVKKYFEVLAINLQEQAKGGAQPFISLGALRKLIFALPPLAEQHRIVTKVDDLMTLCDQLKSCITEANTVQKQLADTIVREATQ